MAEISKTTITGTGAETDPYIINSTEDFLFLSKQTLSGKYIELASDIELNDETFDENGVASGGDGKVYTWQRINTWNENCVFDGKGHTISNYYFNNPNTDQSIALFANLFYMLKNLNVKGMYLNGNKNVFGVSASSSNNIVIENVHNLGGTLRGNVSIAGICREAKSLDNVTNRANIYQHSTTTTKGSVGGISCGSFVKTYNNCVNYGNIDVYLADYCGGIATRVAWSVC